MQRICRRPTHRTTTTFVRFLSIEQHNTGNAQQSVPPPPVPQPSSSTRPNRSRVSSLSPRRPVREPEDLPVPLRLPSNFGRNQLLPVLDSTRALLEEIVGTFHAPIRYAFAYGSGVFEQDGVVVPKDKKPMLDFIFAVSHPEHWHSINLNQNPDHYAAHARFLGSDFIGRVQNLGPAGLWFNPFVSVAGVKIKYGVVSVDNLCSDLLTWGSLYAAGRMHKPIRIIKDDARVRLTQQVNLTSAIRAALLTLPETFDEAELFYRIAGLSYAGDPRMLLPFENRSKVSNIVNAQTAQFKELYHRLVTGLPGVEWPVNSTKMQQDMSPQTRAGRLRKLPATLRGKIDRHYAKQGPSKEADELAYWTRIATDPTLEQVLASELKSIVRFSSTVQTAKGLITSGPGHSLRYVVDKFGKWFRS